MDAEVLDGLLVRGTTSLYDAIARIEATGYEIVLVVDHDRKLKAILTDQDVRRLLLNRVDLSQPIEFFANNRYYHWSSNAPVGGGVALMKQHHIRQLPIVDEAGVVVDMLYLDDIESRTFENPVLIMAGGLGTRLQPLTNDCPKPMLHLNGKPILERIIERLIAQGFRHFVLAVHYLSDVIEAHFSDGSRWGVQIEYIREREMLGTAGALGLWESTQDTPVIVMNGDVVTSVDCGQLLEYHNQHRAHATMCVRSYQVQIPFGVVDLEDVLIRSVREKPLQTYYINAGVYCLSRPVVDLIEKHTVVNMPELFALARGQGLRTIAYLMHEEWSDIGRPDDLVKAQG